MSYSPSPQVLRAEIDSGPLAVTLAPFVAAGDDASIAAALNDRAGTAAGTIPYGVLWADLVPWAAANSTRTVIQAGADDATPDNAAKRAICLTVLDYLGGGLNSRWLDLTKSSSMALLDAAVTLGIFTSAQRTEVVAMGTLPASRAEILWGYNVTITHQQVAAAFGRPGVQ